MLAMSVLGMALCGCIVGPNYVPPTPDLPGYWQNLDNDSIFQTNSTHHHLSDSSSDSSVCLDCVANRPIMGDDCPWWPQFLDEDLRVLIATQRVRSPSLHEFRARVDQAWQQRWVAKQGFFPTVNLFTGHTQNILDSELRTATSESYTNAARADLEWELDVFGGRQRLVESANRELESEVEGWRSAVVFLTGEIGLFYSDYRVAEARISILRENIAFYENMVDIVEQKLSFGSVAEIDLDEAQARLQRERAAMPALERARDNARVELARVVGVYSQELDPLLSPARPIPQPPPVIEIPSPNRVLRSRPDIRRLERKIGAQVARVGVEIAELYPEISAGYVFNGGGAASDVIRHAFSIGGEITKRIMAPEREKAQLRAQEIVLQRELWNFEQGLVTAASEVELAIVDIHRAQEQIRAQELAVESNAKAFDNVYTAYREGLVDVRDIIRIRNDLFASQSLLILARDVLAKSTVRLYKGLGGVDLPSVPAHMTPSRYSVAELGGTSHFLSRLFSLNRDKADTLHTNRQRARLGSQPWYHITPEGTLRNGPPHEHPILNRSWYSTP